MKRSIGGPNLYTSPAIRKKRKPRLRIDAGQGTAMQGSIANWPAFDDSVAALKRLKTRYRLVAMTNADNWALGLMASTLDDPFDDTVTCEDVGVNKPDPQVFAYCRGRQSLSGVSRETRPFA